jgi:two-component system chemotaxis response regulator CheY
MLPDIADAQPGLTGMRHCLVVDDSPLVRKVAGFLLEDLEFAVAEASSTAEALEHCRKRMPDVIMLDADLPENAAIEFITALRAEPAGTKPVIVLCVVERDMRQITEAGAAGANTYLLKPFDARTVRDKFVKIGLAA